MQTNSLTTILARTALLGLAALFALIGCDGDGSSGTGYDVARDGAGAADVSGDSASPYDTTLDVGGGADVWPADSDMGGDDASGGPPTSERYRNRLGTAGDFGALAREGELKWLAPVDGAEVPAPLDLADCWFQNMHLAEWHLQFLLGFEELAGVSFEDYVAWVTEPETRLLWGGGLKTYPGVRHPLTGNPGIYAWTIYTNQDPGGMAAEDPLVVHERLQRCAPFAADLLVFVVHGDGQKTFANVAGATWDAAGLPWLRPEQLVAGVDFLAHSHGQGYGTLRVIPRGEGLDVGDYGPRDVVVVESAPHDIGIVQGLVTADPQNEHSHVNLRLQEKGTPNATLPSVYEMPFVTDLDGTLVHIVVGRDGVTVEPARLEDARAFWEASRPPVGEVVADLEVRELTSFAEMGADDASAYGAKAANLGELHGALPSDNRVDGFGVSFLWYTEFVAANGFTERIAEMVADPRMDGDRVWRAETLKELRRDMKRGALPDGFEAELHARLRAVFGDDVETTRIRFRSSTNAEDLDAFSGAGLYASRSGCLADDLDGDDVGPSRCLGDDERAWAEAELARRRAELVAHPERSWLPDIIEELEDDLTSEKTVASAVRKVWASLWNDRAYEERAYYGIAHESVYMGIAVNPSFVLERVNAVAVTNLAPDDGAPLYRVVSQVGEWSVVQPEDPLAVPEVLTFRRGGGDPPAVEDVRLVVPSALVPDGEQVWPADALAELAAALYMLQDHFAAAVYPDLTPLHLDCEVKLTQDGRVVVKQARPFLGGGGEF